MNDILMVIITVLLYSVAVNVASIERHATHLQTNEVQSGNR